MKFAQLSRLLLSALLLATVALTGCGKNDNVNEGARIQEAQNGRTTSPLQQTDLQTFEVELFRTLSVPTDSQKDFRILDTQDTPLGTYVLYSIPNHDGLAFAGRRADGSVQLYQAHWPMTVTDPAQDLVVCRAIPPNSGINNGYGVLAGRVYNPFIETIEVNYRDGKRERLDVSHSRGFLLVRPGFDSRFVQVRGFGFNGNPYWNLDAR
ncbi:hypothetical protein [Tumebacillus flagellatus]|uniref:Lipoprotein n=1 Tax=Tumebacillus flagellatus TaxID=1157490 RepID=A0A074LMH6_9BACL|nr:hypothetical protein [Tumebacillus flagellatus]KEO81068.1 hypothetical protein EL26_22790 [Tumebacillus flagellatus]